MKEPPLRVLLVDDDEDDYFITADLLSEIEGPKFDLEWVSTYEEALELMGRHQHDVYLVDYRLGGQTGLELLRAAVASGCQAPIIMLTGQGDHEVDLEAMRTGAADYLVKGQISAPLLERSIRYALDRQRTLRALRESEERYRDLYEEAPIAYFTVAEDGKIQQANRRAVELLGYSLEELIGRPMLDLYADTPAGKEKAQEVFSRFHAGAEIRSEELELRRADGRSVWISLSMRPIRDEEGRVLVSRSMAEDITERKRAEEKLREAAILDSLTGLYNRRHLLERLVAAISAARRYGHPLSLAICDLDGFKTINDTYGHAVGDEVLVAFSRLLKKELRLDDIEGRLGGDEFCLIFPHTSAANAAIAVERIRSHWEKKVFQAEQGPPFSMTATFGVADFVPGKMRDEKNLLKAADDALYRAKERGRNQIAVNGL